VRNIIRHKTKDLEDVLYAAGFHGRTILADPFSEELAEGWKKYFAYVDELAALLKRHDIGLIFIIYPDITTVFDRGKGNYQQILIKAFEEKGIDYIDLRPIFQAQKENYLNLYLDLPRDFHISPLGKKILAEEIYGRISSEIP